MNQLINHPSAPLSTKSSRIKDPGAHQRLVARLRVLAEAHNATGIAAPQIGVSKQLFLVQDKRGGWEAHFNPEVINARGKQTREERCLSIPGYSVTLKRPASLEFCSEDQSGVLTSHTAQGVRAVAIQHEIDHLNGCTIKDRAGL